jgi:hypothetical protein
LWKKVIIAIYFRAPRERCLDRPLPNSKGSSLWKLIKVVAPLIQIKLSWYPINGASINIWIDSIMEKEPLGRIEELQSLREWSIRHGVTNLGHFSQWVENGKWAGWKTPNHPPHLQYLVPKLFHALAGYAPVDSNSTNERYWGNSKFSIKIGF